MNRSFGNGNSVAQLICLEVKAAFSEGANWLQPLLLLILITVLFGFSMQYASDAEKHSHIIIWLGFLLSISLSIGNFFQSDRYSGYLEQMIISSHDLKLICLYKCIVHWLVTCLPLIVFTPILSLIMGMELDASLFCTLTIFLATPALSFIAVFGAYLSISLKNSNILLCIILLPFYVPILIFGAGAMQLYVAGVYILPQLLLLFGISLLTVVLTPILCAYTLSLNYS